MNVTTLIIGLIGLFILIGIISHIQLTFTLNSWLTHVKELVLAPNGTRSSIPWIQDTIERYKKAASSEHTVQTQALIDAHFARERIRLLGLFPIPISNASRLLSHLPSFTIILGVLGTFIGLTESMFSMQHALLTMGNNSGTQVSADTILQTIASPFKGMSLAFITSIAGIGASLFLNLVQGGFLSNGQSIAFITEKLLTEIETLLDHTVRLEIRDNKPNDWYESILDRLADRIHQSFDSTLGDFSKNVFAFTSQLGSSVEQLEALLKDFATHREALTTASNQLVSFGESFQSTTEAYHAINDGMGKQLDRMNESVGRVLTRMEQQEKRTDQQTKQLNQVLESSQKQSESLSRQFLHALEQQMQSFHDRYDHASETLGRQQEDWLYQHRDMNTQYTQGSETMVHALEQLERSLLQAAEKLKRDIFEQQKYQQDRQLQLLTRDQDRGSEREMIRFFDQLMNGIDRGFDDQRRYFQEFIQLLSRVASLLEQQRGRSNTYEPAALTTRVIDS